MAGDFHPLRAPPANTNPVWDQPRAPRRTSPTPTLASRPASHGASRHVVWPAPSHTVSLSRVKGNWCMAEWDVCPAVASSTFPTPFALLTTIWRFSTSTTRRSPSLSEPSLFSASPSLSLRRLLFNSLLIIYLPCSFPCFICSLEYNRSTVSSICHSKKSFVLYFFPPADTTSNIICSLHYLLPR